MKTYYCRSAAGEPSRGPLRSDELRALAAEGWLKPSSQVSVDGKKWVLASRVRGLFSNNEADEVTLEVADPGVGVNVNAVTRLVEPGQAVPVFHAASAPASGPTASPSVASGSSLDPFSFLGADAGDSGRPVVQGPSASPVAPVAAGSSLPESSSARRRSTSTGRWAFMRVLTHVNSLSLIASLLLAIAIRLPSTIHDVQQFDRHRRADEHKERVSRVFSEAVARHKKVLTEGESLSEPPKKGEIEIAGRPLLFDVTGGSISSLHSPLGIWSKPLSTSEKLTLFLIVNRSDQRFPEFYTYVEQGTNRQEKVDGYAENGEIVVVRYPSFEPVCRFRLESQPPTFVWDQQNIRPGQKLRSPARGRIETAFESWYGRAFEQGWNAAEAEHGMTFNRESELAFEAADPRQSSMLMSLGESPLKDFQTEVSASEAVVLHLQRFGLVWLLAWIPCFGAGRLFARFSRPAGARGSSTPRG